MFIDIDRCGKIVKMWMRMDNISVSVEVMLWEGVGRREGGNVFVVFVMFYFF